MVNCAGTTNDAAAYSPNTAESAQTSAAEDKGSPVSPGDSKRGQQLTAASGCLACHSLHATAAMVGPTWYNLAETAELRIPGQSAELYLHTSIVSPNAYIVEGYSPNVMVQTYARSLSEGELADIVSYLLTLEE
jgi:cytochrome c